ncbi:MAG: matrixin family metalloprotease, partial [Georgenia sp.]
FNRSGEPADRSTMIDDVRGALAILAAQTGLRFVEATDPAQAELAFGWADLTNRGPNVAGVGGPRGTGKGSVTFSNNNWWTTNEWAGLEIRRIEWPRPDLGPGWYSYREGPGRQALVMHEAMHAMGFDHVSDFTSIMHSQILNNGAGQLSAGDIDGLRTLYPSNPCPAIPD